MEVEIPLQTEVCESFLSTRMTIAHQTSRRLNLIALVTWSDLHKEERVIGTEEKFVLCPSTVDHILEKCDDDTGKFFLDEGNFGYMFGDGKILAARMTDPNNGYSRDIPYTQFAAGGKRKIWVETTTLAPAEEDISLEPQK